jgi:hypothetical protein
MAGRHIQDEPTGPKDIRRADGRTVGRGPVRHIAR